MAEPDRVRRDKRGAFRHYRFPLTRLPARLGLGQVSARIDAQNFAGIPANRSRLQPPGARQADHVGQVIFLVGIVVRDLAQKFEHQLGIACHHARIDQSHGPFGFVRILVLDDSFKFAGLVCDQASVGARRVRLKAQHRNRRTALQRIEDARHRPGSDQRRVAIKDDYIAIEAFERILGGTDGMACPERRILHRGFGAGRLSQGIDLRGFSSVHRDDAIRPRLPRQVDGPLDHRAAGNRMGAFRQIGFHPRTETGGEDDGCARLRHKRGSRIRRICDGL